MLPLAAVDAVDADDLYRGLMTICWRDHLQVESSIAIDFSGQNDAIRNTRFGAQRCKDAIVDWFVRDCGRRPNVSIRDPDLRLNVRLAKARAQVALDFSGGSLHRRGYRLRGGQAPLKENLAAAILLRADWPAVAAGGGALIDPMCGSATLLLEGAMIAADMAPGLARSDYGFHTWRGHNEAQWQAILADARGRAERGRAGPLPEIRGYDADPAAVRRGQENSARLGLEKTVRISCKPLANIKKPTHKKLPDGLLVCNPPYGERLGEKASLRYLYQQLGEVMANEFRGWRGAIFTADTDLGRATGLRSHKRYRLWNGALESSLLLFDLHNNELRQPPGMPASAGSTGTETTAPADTLPGTPAAVWPTSGAPAPGAPAAGWPAPGTPASVAPASANPPTPDAGTHTPGRAELSAGAQMFANRIRKNRRRLASWLKRERIECYRLYDADMPEYAVAVDIYGEDTHVAEYRAPDSVDPEAAAQRLAEVRAALPGALDVDPGRIWFKQRRRQRGNRQYQKQDSLGQLVSVREGPAKLLVNLGDYLDTGLFLDHRPLRRLIAGEASGADFLNLFCYTGSATVHAALGGARSTTSVDLSNTYLGWLRKNLAHNGLGEARNRVVRADCRTWLAEAAPDFDLILLDPPSFSNSKGMDGSFDVQRDHPELVRKAMARLRPQGSLYFSNNRRGFRLASDLAEEFDCQDIAAATLDPDFQRRPGIHHCWRLRHLQAD